MLDDADEVAIECAIYKREIACNKTVNRLTRLMEYIDANEAAAAKHIKAHPFDLQKLKRIQASTAKL